MNFAHMRQMAITAWRSINRTDQGHIYLKNVSLSLMHRFQPAFTVSRSSTIQILFSKVN